MDAKVVEVATKFVGRPFQFGKFDCYKLVIEWFKEFGYVVPDYTYDRFWYHAGRNFFLEEYHKLWRKVEPNEPQLLHDVALFKILAPVPNHVGICLGDGRFIHCAENTATVISRLDKYKNVLYSIYRLRATEQCP